MNTEHITIRIERTTEHRAVEELVREAFWNVYRPGCLEHYVLHLLREDPCFVKELDLVMEQSGRLVGQTVSYRTALRADDGRSIPILTMGPICVLPELQRTGLGKRLLDESLAIACRMGFGAVCMEGNIDFYGHSGFTVAADRGIRYADMPEGEVASFFLCRELIPGYLDGITGVYATPSVYLVDESETERYDASFPPREKLRLPGQLF